MLISCGTSKSVPGRGVTAMLDCVICTVTTRPLVSFYRYDLRIITASALQVVVESSTHRPLLCNCSCSTVLEPSGLS